MLKLFTLMYLSNQPLWGRGVKNKYLKSPIKETVKIQNVYLSSTVFIFTESKKVEGMFI